jgi:hypothetical protein
MSSIIFGGVSHGRCKLQAASCTLHAARYKLLQAAASCTLHAPNEPRTKTSDFFEWSPYAKRASSSAAFPAAP